MKTLYSTKYIDTDIVVGDIPLSFHKGQVQVQEAVAEKILKRGYANIFEELPQLITPKEEVMTGTFNIERKVFQEEISRLRGIIEAKEQTITGLEGEVESWKTEYEKLVNSKENPPAQKETATSEIEASNEGPRAQFEKFTKEEIVTLLCQSIEGFDPTKVRTLKKDELIDYALANM